MGQRKSRKNRIVSGILVLVQLSFVLFCLWGLSREKESYLMEEQTTRAFGGSRDENGTYRIDEYDVLPEGVFLSMELPGLKKGVYEVQIAYDADAEQVSRVSSDSAGYRKLYTNTVSLRPSNIQKEVAYRFMLLENADDLSDGFQNLGVKQ